jgi:hypothetical protein
LAAGIALAMAFTLNACGPSKAELAIMAMPSIGEVSGLKDKLIWLEGNVQSGGNYVLELDADEEDEFIFASSNLIFSYKDKSDITITLKGIGRNRTICSESRDFIVRSGVTLILDNITLRRKHTKNHKSSMFDYRLVEVFSGGTLVMNEGSAIVGAANGYNGPVSRIINTGVELYSKVLSAGVQVYDGGTFIMNGGTISGNTLHQHNKNIPNGAGVCVNNGGTFIMKGGTISGNNMHPSQLTAQEIEYNEKIHAVSRHGNILGRGAGVYVDGGFAEYESSIPNPLSFIRKSAPSGTFIKTGGTITGYSSDPQNGNVVRSIEGQVLNGFGHAVFFDAMNTPSSIVKRKEPIAIDTTIGPEITIYFKNGIFSKGRKEEAKPQEAIAEPEEATAPSDVPAEAQPQEGE